MSLRTRLVAATALVVVVAVGGAALATQSVFTRSLINQVDVRLDQAAAEVISILEGDPDDPTPAIRQSAPGVLVQLRDSDGTAILNIRAGKADDDDSPSDHRALDRALDGLAISASDRADHTTVAPSTSQDRFRVRSDRLGDGRVLLIGATLHEADESAGRLVRVQTTSAILALSLAILLGLGLITVGLRPLRRTERTALAIAEGGDLDLEVAGADRSTEVGRVASALNTMLARIRSAFAERDATEAALRESEARMRRFVADVSHELRTPLTAVRAYVELIDRGARAQPADLDRALSGVATETARMAALVDELLLLARLDQHRLPELSDVDLSEVVIEAVAMAQTVDSRHPIDLRVDEVVTVRGDRAQLRQVVDNLLRNVHIHTPAGTRSSVELTAADGRATLVVSDDGPGGAPDHAERAFERFYRADESRARSSGGTGLGLAIVRAIAEAHHGTVLAETSAGGGWTVRVALPCNPTDPDPEQPEGTDP